MKITFLGTTSMIPTKERNAFSILISHENENILIDCGEGTQRQLRLIGFSPPKITKILITHWHGDHILGLPGLLQTLAASNYSKTLELYGPKNTKSFLKKVMDMFVDQGKIKISVKEVNTDGIFYNDDNLSISAVKLDHTTTCLGYSIVEADKRKINLDYLKKFGLLKHPLLGKLQKGHSIVYKGKKIAPSKATIIKKGKKVAIITDTRLCNQCYSISKDSDLLICESTFLSNLKEKASDYKHLTAEQAGLIAKRSNSKKLFLTHFSQRYKDTKEVESEVKKVFRESYLASDLLSIDI